MATFGSDQTDKLPEIMGKTHLGAEPEVYLGMYHTDKTFEEAVKETYAYDDVSEPEDLWTTDEDAVEKAAYQKYIADQSTMSIMAQNPGMSPVDAEIAAISSTAGMLTPWGPALEPLGVIDVLDEYPGAEYLGNVNSDETAETLGDTSSLLRNHLTQLEEAEELIQKNAEDTGGNLWDGVKQFGQAIAGSPLLPLGIEPAQIADIGAGIGDALGSLYDSVHNTHETIGDSIEMDALLQTKMGGEMTWGPGPSEESLGEFGAIQDKIYQREQNQTLDTMLQADGPDMMAAQISDPSLYKGDMASLTEEDVQTWLDSLSERDQIDPVMVDELETAFERAKMALRTPAEFGPEQFQTPPPPSVVATPQPGAEPFATLIRRGTTEPKPPGLYNVPQYAMEGEPNSQNQMGPIGLDPAFPQYPIGLPPITPSMGLFQEGSQATDQPMNIDDMTDFGDVMAGQEAFDGTETGEGTYGVDIMSAIGKSDSDTFATLFNKIPGSQRHESQQAIPGLFNQTEALYHLYNPFSTAIDKSKEFNEQEKKALKDQVETNLATGAKAYDPNVLGLGSKAAAAEASSFESWADEHMRTKYGTERYGEDFYSNVRDLATRQRVMAGTMQSQYTSPGWLSGLQEEYGVKDEEGELSGPFAGRREDDLLMEMDRFMAPKGPARNRLVNLVTMYNMPQGADAYTRKVMRKSYDDLYDSWLLADKTTADYLEDFTSTR